MMSKPQDYDRVAALYDLLDLPFEYGRYRAIRRQLFVGVNGSVLDAGVGTGRNMPFYPPGAEVIGIDLSAQMLARARRRRTSLGVLTELKQGDIRATSFANARFDYIVATFLFCVLSEEDQLPALRELKRICRPHGEIRLLEYAYSVNPFRRFIMRLWAPWARLVYGAAFDRDTEHYVEAAGLALVEKRFVFKDIIKLLVLRHREREQSISNPPSMIL